MSLTQVNKTDTIPSQRLKINEISSNLGDAALIDSDILALATPNTDVVNALNALKTFTQNIERSAMIRAITLA